jgi:hypothetical protein
LYPVQNLQKTIAFSGEYLIVCRNQENFRIRLGICNIITINNRIKIGIPVFSRIGLAFLLADPKGWVISFKKF